MVIITSGFINPREHWYNTRSLDGYAKDLVSQPPCASWCLIPWKVWRLCYSIRLCYQEDSLSFPCGLLLIRERVYRMRSWFLGGQLSIILGYRRLSVKFSCLYLPYDQGDPRDNQKVGRETVYLPNMRSGIASARSTFPVSFFSFCISL